MVICVFVDNSRSLVLEWGVDEFAVGIGDVVVDLSILEDWKKEMVGNQHEFNVGGDVYVA